MSNIRQVASRAGVSIKTVSRVLNNEKYVRPETSSRIRAAITELNYTPNLAARQLAANRSFLFILLISACHSTSCEQLFLAAASECRRVGYRLMIEIYDPAAPCNNVVSNLIESLRPDGIMVTAAHWHDPSMMKAIRRSGIPLVCLAEVSDSYGVSIQDGERKASEALVGHLIALGHRRIAMIGPPDRCTSAENRLRGYFDAICKSGLSIETCLVVRGDFSFSSGLRIALCLLKNSTRPTAIFAANDSMALGTLAAARQIGLRVPADLAVAGFEDSPEATRSFPRLTSVHQPFAVMARAAVASLLGKPIDTIDTTHRIMIRRSTAQLVNHELQ